jgi:hypothetical protein
MKSSTTQVIRRDHLTQRRPYQWRTGKKYCANFVNNYGLLGHRRHVGSASRTATTDDGQLHTNNTTGTSITIHVNIRQSKSTINTYIKLQWLVKKIAVTASKHHTERITHDHDPLTISIRNMIIFLLPRQDSKTSDLTVAL